MYTVIAVTFTLVLEGGGWSRGVIFGLQRRRRLGALQGLQGGQRGKGVCVVLREGYVVVNGCDAVVCVFGSVVWCCMALHYRSALQRMDAVELGEVTHLARNLCHGSTTRVSLRMRLLRDIRNKTPRRTRKTST